MHSVQCVHVQVNLGLGHVRGVSGWFQLHSRTWQIAGSLLVQRGVLWTTGWPMRLVSGRHVQASSRQRDVHSLSVRVQLAGRQRRARGLRVSIQGLCGVRAEHVLRRRARPGDLVSGVFLLPRGEHRGGGLQVRSRLHGRGRRPVHRLRRGDIQGRLRERRVRRVPRELLQPGSERRARGLSL
jgi:hypothetical protein